MMNAPLTVAGKIEALFLGKAKEVETDGSAEWWDKPWRTGFYKNRQINPSWLGYEGFRGDEQADRVHHGRVEKAVCVYSAEHYPDWLSELSLAELPYGAFGENLTVSGLTEEQVYIGDVYRVGEALVQVSQPRQPCWKLARRWHIKDLAARVERTGRTGFYFRVLQHGWVIPEAEITLEKRGHEQWSIAICNHVMHHDKHHTEAARALADCRELSASWKDQLWQRAQGGIRSSSKRTEQPS